jgi:hypothetical protein
MPADEHRPPDHDLSQTAVDEDPLGGPRTVPAAEPPTVGEAAAELDEEAGSAAPKSTMPSSREPGAAP